MQFGLSLTLWFFPLKSVLYVPVREYHLIIRTNSVVIWILISLLHNLQLEKKTLGQFVRSSDKVKSWTVK